MDCSRTYGSSTYSSTTTYYVRDNRGNLLEWASQGTRYFYIGDALGSVIAMVDVNGAVARSYTYDPYGNISSQSGTVQNLWTYTGKLAQTDTSIYKIGQRYYDANTGRWTQTDPVVNPLDTGNGNRFLYAGDDPVSATDPSGEWSISLGVSVCFGGCLGGSLDFGSNGFGVSGQVGRGTGAGADLSLTAQSGDVSSSCFSYATVSGAYLTGQVEQGSNGDYSGGGGLTTGSKFGAESGLGCSRQLASW